jgi:hypothetical protein
VSHRLENKKKTIKEDQAKSEDVEDDDNYTLEHLSDKDKQILMKLVEKLEELEQENEKQFKSLENQEELLIEKIEALKDLTEKHEKLKCSHACLVERYGKSSNEQTYATNSLSHVAQLEEENSMLKDKMEKLTNMCETWQEKITMSLCALIISLSTLLQCWKLLMRL